MPSHAAPADTRCSFSRIGRACSCRSRCIRERLTVSREAGLHSPPLREERLVPVGRDRSRPARRVEPGDLLRREAPPEGAEVLPAAARDAPGEPDAHHAARAPQTNPRSDDLPPLTVEQRRRRKPLQSRPATSVGCESRDMWLERRIVSLLSSPSFRAPRRSRVFSP